MATGRVPTTANSPLTAKGDLFGYSTTQARVAVGNNGETLVADSSTSTGLRYQPTSAAGKNGVINGGFDVWQRGTSFTGSNSFIYTADRWAWRDTSGGLASFGQVTSSLPNGFRYGFRLGRTSGSTFTNIQLFETALETNNSIPFANQTVTISFYAKKGANFSPTQLGVILYSGTGTDQTVGGTFSGAAAWTGASAVINQNITAATLTTSWVRYSYTGNVASTATQLGLEFALTPVGTAGADDYIYITGVQIEVGSVATQFSRAGATIQGELSAAQRYYQVIGGTTNSFPLIGGYIGNGETLRMPMIFPVQMRVAPTITKNGTWNVAGIGQPSAVYINTQGFSIQAVGTANGYYMHPDSTDDTFTISAEL
jgi:hypothetical protein